MSDTSTSSVGGSDFGATGIDGPGGRRPPNPAERTAFAFSSALNLLSAVWLVSMTLLILCDVTGREIFGMPIYGTYEIVANSVLSILFLQLPLSIVSRNMLRTTIFYGLLSDRGKSYLDSLSYLLAALFFAAIAYGSWPAMREAWAILEVQQNVLFNIPVYPIRTLVVVVSLACIPVCLLLIWQSLRYPSQFAET